MEPFTAGVAHHVRVDTGLAGQSMAVSVNWLVPDETILINPALISDSALIIDRSSVEANSPRPRRCWPHSKIRYG